MDTSNRQQFLINILGLEIPELHLYSQDDWLFVINTTIDLFKPYLKYLSGFVELLELYDIRNDEYDGAHSIIPPSVVEKRESFDNRTRCRIVCRFFSELRDEDRNSADWYYAKWRGERQLLISQKGEWILWDATYRRKNLSGDLSLPPSSRTEERARILVIQPLSTEKLEDLVKKYDLGFVVFSKLSQILKESIEQKRERLKKLVLLSERINRITDNESLIVC